MIELKSQKLAFYMLVGVLVGVGMGVGRSCPPVCDDIVTPQIDKISDIWSEFKALSSFIGTASQSVDG